MKQITFVSKPTRNNEIYRFKIFSKFNIFQNQSIANLLKSPRNYLSKSFQNSPQSNKKNTATKKKSKKKWRRISKNIFARKTKTAQEWEMEREWLNGKSQFKVIDGFPFVSNCDSMRGETRKVKSSLRLTQKRPRPFCS